MESSSCKRLKESPQELTTEDTSGQNCRLRSTLNEDCILKVLELLNVDDLLQMCRVDSYFDDLILKWIIGKKFIDFSVMSKKNRIEIFKKFGKSLRKFKTVDTDLNDILLNIITYCQPATFTEVYLKWTESELDTNIIQRAMPFFSNIRKLNLNSYDLPTSDEFLNEIAVTATNLRILHLHNVAVTGRWLRTSQMGSLFELGFYDAREMSFTDLNIFLCNHTQIQVFSLGNRSTTVKYCKYLPNTRQLEDIHISRDISDIFARRHSALAMENRYDFLSTLSSLHSVTLSSYTHCGSDLHNVFKKLASKNIVKLNVVAELQHATDFDEAQRARFMESKFTNFTSLQEFELKVRHSDSLCEIQCDFIFHFVSQLKNLETFIFDCNKRLSKVNKILDVMPTIRKLSINKVAFQHLPGSIWKIARKLREIRQMKDAENDSNLLHIIVNMQQYREFKVYKDIDDIMTIGLEHFLRNGSDYYSE